jgi:hypothetical protein
MALDGGYDAEVDVWSVDGEWFLGHDRPLYRTSLALLQNERVWCHAKDIPALDRLLDASCHCFIHDRDEATLTSKGIIWTYPGKLLTKRSVCLFPERHHVKPIDCHGICSDFVGTIRLEE